MVATHSTQLLLGSSELPASPRKEPPNKAKALFHKPCERTALHIEVKHASIIFILTLLT